MRILLVNALNSEVEVESRYPSLGMGYLVSSVRKALPGEKLEFLIKDKDVHAAAARFKPHLAGISSVSQNFGIAREYAQYFVSKGIPVLIGGVHISALPECLPEGVTAACLGESEDTFVEFIKAMLGGFTPQALAGIPGIAYREDGALKFTEPRPQRTDLDSIPMPARDLLDIRPHTYMFTSRGCPFRCSFCSSSRFWDKLRFFSADYVVDEIELLVRDYGVSMISFFDDLFVANFQRLEEIAVLLEKRNLIGKTRLTCSCRANVVKPELARLLKRIGVVSVGMGLESGDEETL
ncbi:MAG: radical SAM protein, partial [Nitrospirota bacterium]